MFFDSAELEAHALALAPNGGLYVGTSPDGKIYKVDRNGTATTFFDPRGQVHLGDGQRREGQPVRRRRATRASSTRSARTAKAAVFYKTNTTHAMTLAFDKAGNLLAGTGTGGKVLRIDPDGKAFVLLDSPFQEIRSLRFDDKGVLLRRCVERRAADQAARRRRSRTIDPIARRNRRAQPVPSVSAEITSISIVDVGGSADQGGGTREDRRSVKGGVYRIAPDGVWDQLWESREDSPHDLTFDPSGALIVATGNKGKIYRLEGDPIRPALVARASAQQVTSFYKRRTRPPVLLHRQSRQSVQAVVRARVTRHLRVRGARRADGGDVGRDELARDDAGWFEHRAVHANGQHRDARRHVERVVGGLHQQPGLDDHEPEGAVHPVARGVDRQDRGPRADVGFCGVPAAQPAAAGPFHHRPHAGHRFPETVCHRRSRSGRLRRSDDPGSQAGRRRLRSRARNRSSGAARIRRGCRRWSGRPTTRTTTTWSTT